MRIADQIGNELFLESVPRRIVCTVPSLTEFVVDLCGEAALVGVTKFCIHPPTIQDSAAIVGGTKNLNINKILALQPDLVIANKEENVEAQIVEIGLHVPVYVSDIETLAQAYEAMLAIGALLNKRLEAQLLVNNIQHQFGDLKLLRQSITCAYAIWHQPLMVAGGGTFINEMLTLLGFKTAIYTLNGDRYPTIEPVTQLNVQMLLLATEPYPFSEKHVDLYQQFLPQTKIMLVDGEAFSWYGSRMLKSVPYFKKLIQEVNEIFSFDK